MDDWQDTLNGGWIHRKASTYTAQNNTEQTQRYTMGLEPIIPVFERPKTVRALDRMTTAIT
jgi:hypothetical protein